MYIDNFFCFVMIWKIIGCITYGFHYEMAKVSAVKCLKVDKKYLHGL